MFKDKNGNTSCFRVMWAGVICCIFCTWCVSCILQKQLLPLPLDGTAIIGLFAAPGIKTGAENFKT